MNNSFTLAALNSLFGRRNTQAAAAQPPAVQVDSESPERRRNSGISRPNTAPNAHGIRRNRSNSSPSPTEHYGVAAVNNGAFPSSPQRLVNASARRASLSSATPGRPQYIPEAGSDPLVDMPLAPDFTSDFDPQTHQEIFVNRRTSTDLQLRNTSDYRFPVDKPTKIRFVPYNPYFLPVEKEIKNGTVLSIGRYQRAQNMDPEANEGIFFRSTVVSRQHAQLMFLNGEFFLKDTKSLGGTFINSSRLSPAGKESNPHKIFHGDVLQFGVDYRPDQRTGQVKNKDKCVEVIVEFPSLVKKQKRNIAKPAKWDPTKHQHTECCICLSSLYLKQALFIAPCQHSFHYRCIAPLLHKPKGFTCPMCRQDSDLRESIWSLEDFSEMDDEEEFNEVQEDHVAGSCDTHDNRPQTQAYSSRVESSQNSNEEIGSPSAETNAASSPTSPSGNFLLRPQVSQDEIDDIVNSINGLEPLIERTEHDTHSRSNQNPPPPFNDMI